MKIIPTALTVLILTALLSWLCNLPQDAGPDVPEGKLASLSFAPYHDGQSPLNATFPSAKQLDDDLRLLAEKTHGIRTYASAEGTMPLIPELARKHGLNLLQGAWIGGIRKGNVLETEELIRSANANPDVVKRVIVGNEVLLRGELGPQELIKYIRAVKAKIKQPVSYADVWSMYMKYPDLIKEVDFITIHILPYWEDEPIAVEDAPAHIERIYKLVRKEADAIAPGKAILIGESGWPSAGKQRGWAVPNVVSEAKFTRGLIKVAGANGFDCNIVEAFNQSWKSALEGVVGANWGLFSADREEVFSLTGKVYEKAKWQQGLLVAMAIFLAVVAAFRKPLQALPLIQLAGFLAFLQILAVVWVNQAEFMWYTSYSHWQRLLTIVIVSLNATLGVLVLQAAYELLAGKDTSAKLKSWLNKLYLVFAIIAIYKTYYLAVDGRYISFPLVWVGIPVLGILAFLLIAVSKKQPWNSGFALLSGQVENNAWLAPTLLAGGFGLLLGETIAFIVSRDFIMAYPNVLVRLGWALTFTATNSQLLLWLACLLVLALPWLPFGRTKAALNLSSR